MAIQKRKKKSKDPIWKKAGSEIKSATTHLGKIFDNSNAKEITDMIAAFGAAYLGATSLDKYPTKGALMGLISYKLARTEGSISQAAGLLGLLTIGAAWSRENIIPPSEGGNPQDFWSRVTNQHCEEGKILEWDALHGWHCVDIPYGGGGKEGGGGRIR